jgi:hypothetical protein
MFKIVRYHFRSSARLVQQSPFTREVRSFVTPHKPLPSQQGTNAGAGREPPDHIVKEGKWQKHEIESIDFDEPNVDTQHTNVQPSISEEDPSGPRDDSTDTDRLENVVHGIKKPQK